MSISRFNATQVFDLIDKKPIFVDVREISEIQQSKFKIDNILVLPLSELENKYSKVLPEDKTVQIVLLCRGGGRSLKAAVFLENQGFQNLVNLEGGILQWEKDGYPIENNSNPSTEDCCSKPGCC